MPYSKAHKEQSRERILGSALQLFTRQGYAQTSIDQVMAHAGLTRGAFYAHFDSKQELYAQAIYSTELFSIFSNPKPASAESRGWIRKLITAYLSKAHLKKTEHPCPLAFLVTDVAINEAEARRAYTDTFLKLSQVMHSHASAKSEGEYDRAMAITAMMIGGMAVARNIDSSKEQERLLNSCRGMILELLGVS